MDGRTDGQTDERTIGNSGIAESRWRHTLPSDTIAYSKIAKGTLSASSGSASDGRCFVSHFRGSEICRTYMRPLPNWGRVRRTEARAFLAFLSLPSGEF